MRNWLYLHHQALSQALRRLAGQPLGTLLSVLVMGITLSIPLGGYLLIEAVSQFAGSAAGTPEISIFLKNGTSASARDAVQNSLKAEPAVLDVHFESANAAAQGLAMRLGIGDVLADLPENPFPDGFIVTLKENDPTVFEALTQKARAWEGVDEVRLDSAWVQHLANVLNLARKVLLTLAVLLGLILVMVSFNTIRLQILTQKAEIEVSRILGATDRFIRRPFYWFGSLQGALGGAISLVAVWIGAGFLAEPLVKVAQNYGAGVRLEGPGTLISVAVIAFAALLGWLGAAVSVRRHLAEEER